MKFFLLTRIQNSIKRIKVNFKSRLTDPWPKNIIKFSIILNPLYKIGQINAKKSIACIKLLFSDVKQKACRF